MAFILGAAAITGNRLGLLEPRLSLAPSVSLGSNSASPGEYALGITIINNGKIDVRAVGAPAGQFGYVVAKPTAEFVHNGPTVPTRLRAGQSTYILLHIRVTDCALFTGSSRPVVRLNVHTWWGTTEVTLTAPVPWPSSQPGATAC